MVSKLPDIRTPSEIRSENAPHRNTEIRRLQLSARKLVSGDMLGAYRSSCKGSGLVYSDLREYQPGDDVKHIHWKATPRTDHVVVKSYDEERQLRVLVAIDTSNSLTAPLHSPLKDRALEFTSLIATLTQRGNDLLGACLFTDTIETFIPPSASPGRHQKILTLLQRPVDPRTSPRRTNLEKVINSLHHSLRKPTLVFILSDFLTPPFDGELRMLASRHDVVLVHLEQQPDALPIAGLVSFTDAESGKVVTIDTSSHVVRKGWYQQILNRREAIKSIGQQCGVDVIHLSDSAIVPLAELMVARGSKRQQPRQRYR